MLFVSENASEPHPHNENLRRIETIGRKEWKAESSYHRRLLAEIVMFGFKTIFGGHLDTHETQRQKTEAWVNCAVLNRMTRLV